MWSIAYESLYMEGIPCQRILSLELWHAPNALGTAKVTGETTAAAMEHFIPRADKQIVSLWAEDSSGERKRFFCGYLVGLDYECSGDYATVTCTLNDMCCTLDIKRQDQTYQDLTKTYREVLQRAYAQAGVEANWEKSCQRCYG